MSFQSNSEVSQSNSEGSQSNSEGSLNFFLWPFKRTQVVSEAFELVSEPFEKILKGRQIKILDLPIDAEFNVLSNGVICSQLSPLAEQKIEKYAEKSEN